MVTREQMVAEAIKRMKMLKMHPNLIAEFKNEGKLNRSEHSGRQYSLNDREQILVNDFEERYGYLVYHVIKSDPMFGLMYSFLYVSNAEDEWEMDRTDINEGYAMTYTINIEMLGYSEFGSIGIAPSIGGVKRTA